MDPVILGSFGGILMLLGIIFMVFKSAADNESGGGPSTEERRNAVMQRFERRLQQKLLPYAEDPVALKIHKRELLKTISKELEMNVMFDAGEKKAMIAELAGFEPTAAS